MAESRFNRYRQLSIQLGEQRARALLDRLQVLALTEPETLREFEAFIDRSCRPESDWRSMASPIVGRYPTGVRQMRRRSTNAASPPRQRLMCLP